MWDLNLIKRQGKVSSEFSYNLVKYFDGPNDGLVSEDSFSWGEKYTFLKTDGKRGISHGDMIDLNRENIPGFDVREFYVGLTAETKKKGDFEEITKYLDSSREPSSGHIISKEVL